MYLMESYYKMISPSVISTVKFRLLKRIPGLRKLARLLRRQELETARERLLNKMPQRAVVAEIGVHRGDYSEEILLYTRPLKLHLIDPWMHTDDERYEEAWYGGGAAGGQQAMENRFTLVQRRFKKEVDSGRVELHRSPSAAAVGHFRDCYFDWIYIDGNHLYDYVKEDLELYYPKVRAGGYVTGDDYGVVGWWDNGVTKAVDEFVSAHGLTLEVFASQFIIRKPSE